MSSLPTTLQLIESAASRNRILAAEAKRLGIRVHVNERTHRALATDHRNPDRLFMLTMWSCACARFCQTGECPHHALLLDHLGQLPIDPNGGAAEQKRRGGAWPRLVSSIP